MIIKLNNQKLKVKKMSLIVKKKKFNMIVFNKNKTLIIKKKKMIKTKQKILYY